MLHSQASNVVFYILPLQGIFSGANTLYYHFKTKISKKETSPLLVFSARWIIYVTKWQK